MSKKTVKVKANYPYELRTPNLWGVPFQKVGKVLVGETDPETAEQLIEAGRCEPYDEKAEAKKTKEDDKKKASTDVDFASDEAGELNAKLVADKTLTAKEFKKIEGTGENGAITVGDIENYVAAKNPPPPPAAV